MSRPNRANQWFALDASTPVRSRARELRRAWEDYLGQGSEPAVRIPIMRSWERSRAAGIDPLQARVAPTVVDADEISARWEVHPLAAAAPLILEILGEFADEAERVIAVTDAAGVLLWVAGDRRIQAAADAAINFAAGARWSESSAGTNAIGVALADGHPVQVFAAEHFNEGVQAWVCAAAPIHDPDSGELLGAIDLTARALNASPVAYSTIVATARAVETQLRSEMQERDFRLRSRWGERVDGHAVLATPTGRLLSGSAAEWVGDTRLELPAGGGELILPSGEPAFAEPLGHGEAYVVRRDGPAHATTGRPRIALRLLGRDRAVIERDGQTLTLSRRLSEVIALLASRPDGMNGEELAADLYGDAGRPGAARVEMYRLRQLLPGAAETEPYRLVIDVQSDVARIAGLLNRGATREAAAHYEGPLLPRSEAPGIVRERDALEAWLRNAVMTADDPEALWAWVQSPSGRDDMPAWKRLLAQLDFRDPRRSLAASQVSSLRARYALAPDL